VKDHADGASSPPGPNQTNVDDWWGLGDLLVLATEQLAAPVEGMHRAIADRWFGLAGTGAASAGQLYQAFAGRIYGSVCTAGSVLGFAVGLGAAVGGRGALPPLWRSSLGSGIQAAANAVWGDQLEGRGSDLRIELGLRDALGETIAPDPVSLARAFPRPTTRLVVLLHGLGETERCWQGQTDDDEPAIGLGDLLIADSFTPLLVRYNTGRHLSDNGADLAALVEEITLGWPVAVEEVALVGNSMGGLVARSSIHAGRSAGHRWVGLAQHVVALGSPHLGAPLEKGANLVSWGLGLAPESRPLADFLNQRSAGIKDLRFGAIREGDWRGSEPDVLLRNVVGDEPLPEGAEQHFVAGVITTDPTHPVGVLVGDLIVRVGSGTGRGRRRRVEAADVRVLGGHHHFNLPRDPAVHQQVRDWLTPETSPHRI
jgi:pimeloyl-ACP methyl ester carboxylesterase